MNTSAKKAPKYRPVLTESQILHAINLAKKEHPISNESLDLITALSPYLFKIQNGVVEPSSTPSNRVKANSLEALGTPIELEAGVLTKEDRWLLAYTKYAIDPTLCSLREIQDAREHMYLNDLMPIDEVAAFEADTGRFPL